MKILGIETSCDETAIAIIDANGNMASGDFAFSILADTVLSQADLHAQYGGVYPNLAKREHAKNLVPILTKTLGDANMLEAAETPSVSKETIGELKSLLEREPELFALLAIFLASNQKPDIDAIAVTHGPGLEPALWVGVNFARALCLAWNIPLVGVDHMEGHVVISALMNDAGAKPAFPALALLISGGHTELVVMREWLSYKTIGQTRDDAVGEAFDKVARLLDLPYPGGPLVSKLAARAREKNLPMVHTFTRPMLGSDDLDFSFSGLKTAVRNAVQALDAPTEEQKEEIARAFEDAVVDVLVAKVRTALGEHSVHSLIVGGGVSANTHIRTALANLLKREFSETALLLPPPERATDNALMIALVGYFRAKRGDFDDPAVLRAHGTLTR